MKLLKYAFATALVALAFATTNVSAKGKMVPRVYMYGFSASFNDSIVYFTDIVEVDSAWMDSKTNFLLGRDNYALQLKNHLTDNMGQANRTCIVMFNKKRSALEKDYAKMKKLYSGKGKNAYDVRNIAGSDFTFRPIDMSIEEVDETKADKPKKDKKQPKPGKGPQPGGQPMQGGRPPMPQM